MGATKAIFLLASVFLLAIGCKEDEDSAEGADPAAAQAECIDATARMFPEADAESVEKMDRCMTRRLGEDWRQRIADIEEKANDQP